MPRRRPGAVRADLRTRRPPPDRPDRDPPIRGLGPDAQRAVDLLGLGTGRAFEGYRRFLRRPGRWLHVPFHDCPCCDPVHARDELELALIRLPPRARAELRRLVEPLDAEFRRRTLPDPLAVGGDFWLSRAWWHRRLRERD
ncbi:hypothetical protein [Saccharothrix syringae]|uniref:Uncharacterized protein n=1 Tax=Saccharothrix syringae TaxID=103733 RepID=A0A5Q0GW36_SACSY|nr:hypothetical protein [Saccharothrix syringae]QFZ18277.1 hypothetical protein EKG83_12990 [Saccharothrix syringae]